MSGRDERNMETQNIALLLESDGGHGESVTRNPQTPSHPVAWRTPYRILRSRENLAMGAPPTRRGAGQSDSG